MSGFKGTPGPWAVIDGHYPSMKEVSGPSFKINIVMSATDLDLNDYLKRSADARLIAAAPDLFEVLDSAMRMLGSRLLKETFGDEWYEAALAATSKAIGTESRQ